MIIPSIQNENNLHIRKEDRVRETILTEKFKIGGKSLKKIKQLFSFVLICATVLGTLSVYAQEPKDPPSVEEKLQMAEDIREILREVGVGTVEGYEEIPRAEFAAKSTIYAQVLEANVGAIDIVDYNQTAPDGTPWVILEH